MPADRPTLVHCTNGYPLRGESPGDVAEALGTHAAGVKQRLSPGDRLPIGLYLPAAAAERLARSDTIIGFHEQLHGAGLDVRTLNGFPFASFHTPGDPRRVYRPSWADRRRVDHTLHLAVVLAELSAGAPGPLSISTLPVGWRDDGVDEAAAAANLAEVAVHLARLRERTGTRVTLDLEPEPGCLLADATDACRFFDRWFGGPPAREHLGVCHDVCHAATLFLGQAEELGRYRDAGVRVGKVQLSSVPEVVFEGMDGPMVDEAVGLLRTLPGDRSLRQTTVESPGGGVYDDLDDALAAHPRPGGAWRVHHHLPLTLEALGPLRTTRAAVAEALADLAAHGEAPVLETETYTWSALPPPLRADSLAEGLAGELRWAQAEVDRAWTR